MKTLKLNPKKMIAGLVGMLALSLTGCGSSGGSGNNAATPPYGAYCQPGYANCSNTGIYGNGGGFNQSNGLLARAVGFDGGQQLELALSFAGQAGQTSSVPYTGPYAAAGYFVLTSQLAASCPMPAGTYTIQTVSSGYNWNGGTNLNLSMVAQGPGGQVQMTLSNGFVSGRSGGAITGPDQQPYENYVYGTLTIAQCPYLPITIGI
jgi:hypothetical protein